MNIKKQRLLTAGPTPLYPKALQAMMGADLHHRTQDFRDVVLGAMAGLKSVAGHGARRADTDRVWHRRHGSFRHELLFTGRSRDRVLSRQVWRALAGDDESLRARRAASDGALWKLRGGRGAGEGAPRESRCEGRVCAGVGKQHGRGARRSGHGRGDQEPRAGSALRGGCDHGHRNDAAGHRRVGA